MGLTKTIEIDGKQVPFKASAAIPRIYRIKFHRDAQIARINELQDFIKQQPAHLKAFDEALVKRWLERIIIWEDHFTVELKSGLKIDIEG